MKKLLKSCAMALCFCLLFALVGCGGAGKQGQSTLRIYNWGDYIDPDVLQQFEDENPDIHVVYDTFDSNESMLAKMDGGVQYDILVPSDYMIEKLIAEDRLAELDLSKIENYANINDSFKSPAYDPENKYSVPYMWGTLGILYNTSMVNETVDSWNILWNDAYKGQIIMYDSSRDSLAVALRKLGYSVNTKNDSEIQAAADALTAQKPLVKAYMTDAIKQAMIGGSGALAVVYSGDAILCMLCPKKAATYGLTAWSSPKTARIWTPPIALSTLCAIRTLPLKTLPISAIPRPTRPRWKKWTRI